MTYLLAAVSAVSALLCVRLLWRRAARCRAEADGHLPVWLDQTYLS